MSVAFAARAALRVLPIAQMAQDEVYLVPPVFRASCIAWAAAKYPAHAMEFSVAYAAATAADAAAASTITPATTPNAYAAAARAADAAVSASIDAAVRATEAAAFAMSATVDALAYRVYWSAVSADATRVDKGATASVIVGSPLWPKGQPDEIQALWQEMKAALDAEKQDWDVWTDWYEARLAGKRSNQRLEIARAMITDEIWKGGPAKVNAEIKELIKKHKPPPRPKKKSKSSPVPEVPPQRPAALEPVWSNGILVLPSTSAETDGDPEALASALKVLRQEIAELADDADGEANIDKRPIAYLRRNAERIPDHAPTQDELFRLAHVKEFLEGYSKTVNEEWPDFLARRFCTLTLHFDRTVRQFPKWREFVRNANKDRLTPEQAAEVPNLAQKMVDALRDEDAREFIDPPIPAALEKLQAPLKADGENAVQAQLPAIRTEGLLLAEDTVESINNILKEAVAAALADAKVPVALSRAKVVGKKVAKGIGATAKAAASGYADEAQKSVVKEAKRLGKETGPAVTRWVKRLVFGCKVAGGTAGGSGLAYVLIHAFPDKFQWLQPLIAFFS